MQMYRKMYSIMFNAATDVINILISSKEAEDPSVLQCIAQLAKAQQECEEIYISATE